MKLVGTAVECRLVAEAPECMIDDQACDSDAGWQLFFRDQFGSPIVGRSAGFYGVGFCAGPEPFRRDRNFIVTGRQSKKRKYSICRGSKSWKATFIWTSKLATGGFICTHRFFVNASS